MPENPAIAVEALCKSYGPVAALCDVSFAVRAGETCGLLGLNGAGKSTLFQILTGLFGADSGRALLAGHDTARSAPAALARTGIVFQSQALDPDLTLAQSLGHHAAMHGMRAARRGPAIAAALALFDLSDHRDKAARTLSGGTRRRAEIARALLPAPDVLLLDEPTQGLDPAARRGLVSHLRRLAADRGLAVLWATHLVEEVEAADRIVVLHKGTLRHDGPPAAMREATGCDRLEDAFLRLVQGPAA